MRSKVFIFSGPFGGGKTETAVSYKVPGKEGQTVRLVVDPELRADTYQSPDAVDHPEKHQFAFKFWNENALKAEMFHQLMEAAHNEKWEAKPDVIVLDNASMIQDMMFEWWKTKANIVKTATLYGKEKDRILTANTFKIDPGFISMCKGMFKYLLLDLKNQGISVIITAPPHNVWKDYNKRGYDNDGNPFMKILGQTANVMDAWVQLTDVIWTLTRQDKKGDKTTLLTIPKVSMDVFNPKAALPGVPEQFEWPGWDKIWQWYNDRTFTADVTKLQGQDPSWSAEQEEEATKMAKMKFVKDLRGILTLAQITSIFTEPETPAYTRNNHDQLLDFFKTIATERNLTGVPEAPAKAQEKAPETPAAPAEEKAPEAPKAEGKAPVAIRTIDMLVTEAAQYNLVGKTAVFGFLKTKGFKTFVPTDYDQYIAALQTTVAETPAQ